MQSTCFMRGAPVDSEQIKQSSNWPIYEPRPSELLDHLAESVDTERLEPTAWSQICFAIEIKSIPKKEEERFCDDTDARRRTSSARI